MSAGYRWLSSAASVRAGWNQALWAFTIYFDG
jgi:hypothetical protein